MILYYIALIAPPDIEAEASKWKNWMLKNFGCKVALRSPAHITLIPPFRMDPKMENELKKTLEDFSFTRTPFEIKIHGFSHFGKQVIFLDVIPNKKLTSLHADLNRFLFDLKKFPLEKDQKEFHPHITIAGRDFKEKNFEEAWKMFKEKKYSAEWYVKGIGLLRHNSKFWDLVATTAFS